MLHGTHDCVELQLRGSIVSLGASEILAEEAD